jgi:uncharacterized membrane protein YtjA (UPF0391 family)
MLHWALVFFVIAIVAGVFGFTGIAVAAAEIARILFFIFWYLLCLEEEAFHRLSKDSIAYIKL